MKKIKLLLISIAAVTGLLVASQLPATEALTGSSHSVMAKSAKQNITEGINGAGGKSNKTSLPKFLKNIINVILYLLGAVAVVMIIFGGFKYVVSNGNADAVKSAKNTIMYAVVGLVVAILAFAIVNFVVARLT